MVTSKKISQVHVFAGSPWEVAVIVGLLSAAYIQVNVKDEGAEIKLSVPSEQYAEAVRLISTRQ